ncbi:MAG TPA: MFS transporter [Candidatus Dormibacteraeota bacterium]
MGALVLQFSMGLVYVWGALTPYVRAHDHWSPLLIGAVWAGSPVGYSIGMVVAGRLADRLPPRRICWAGLAFMGFGLAVALTLPSGLTFPVFYTGIGLGMGGGIGMAGSVAAATQAFPRRVGTVGGAVTASYALAALVQVPVASSLAPALGWVGALRVLGAVLVLLAAAALAWMPALPVPHRPADAPLPEAPLRMFLRPLILTGFLVEVCTGPVGSDAFVNIVTYARGIGIPQLLATSGLLAASAGNAVGRLFGGAAADRFGVDRVLAVVLGANLVAALLLWQLSAPLLLVAAAAAGIGFGGAAGVLSRLAAQAAPEAPNSAFGLLFPGYSIGSLIGPLVGAVIGIAPAGWLAMGGFPAAGLLVLAYRASKQKGHRPQAAPLVHGPKA